MPASCLNREQVGALRAWYLAWTDGDRTYVCEGRIRWIRIASANAHVVMQCSAGSSSGSQTSKRAALSEKGEDFAVTSAFPRSSGDRAAAVLKYSHCIAVATARPGLGGVDFRGKVCAMIKRQQPQPGGGRRRAHDLRTGGPGIRGLWRVWERCPPRHTPTRSLFPRPLAIPPVAADLARNPPG